MDEQVHDQRLSKLAGRFWPSEERRPGESVSEWCRRLDGYANGPEGVSDDDPKVA